MEQRDETNSSANFLLLSPWSVCQHQYRGMFWLVRGRTGIKLRVSDSWPQLGQSLYETFLLTWDLPRIVGQKEVEVDCKPCETTRGLGVSCDNDFVYSLSPSFHSHSGSAKMNSAPNGVITTPPTTSSSHFQVKKDNRLCVSSSINATTWKKACQHPENQQEILVHWAGQIQYSEWKKAAVFTGWGNLRSKLIHDYRGTRPDSGLDARMGELTLRLLLLSLKAARKACKYYMR